MSASERLKGQSAVLPEIIAVIKAAENVHAIWAMVQQCEKTTQQALRESLIALDYKLMQI